MRFFYPHRVYMFGIMLLTAILLYGIVVLYYINLEGQLPTLFVPFYGAVSFIAARFYFKRYLFYKKRYIDVYMLYIEFCIEGQCIHLNEDDIESIYVARHRQLLKIHRVLHIFGRDGTYMYVTNEINRFNRLIMIVQYYYPSKFKVCHSLIKGIQNITPQLLDTYLQRPEK